MSGEPWYYLRPAEGVVLELATAAYWSFRQGKGRLAEAGGGEVRIVHLVVEIRGTRAERVTSARFLRHELNPNGLIDRHHEEAEWRAASEVSAARVHRDPTAKVCSIAPELARRRIAREHRWQPAAADLEALCHVVNGRAGQTVLEHTGATLLLR